VSELPEVSQYQLQLSLAIIKSTIQILQLSLSFAIIKDYRFESALFCLFPASNYAITNLN